MGFTTLLLGLKGVLDKIAIIKCQPMNKLLPQSVSVNLSQICYSQSTCLDTIHFINTFIEGIEIIIFEEGNWEFYKDDET